MSVVRFKKRAHYRRRLSLRHYICTDAGPLRVTSRLARELAHREVAAPQFANSVQRMVEVFVETVAGEIKDIQIRPTHHYAAEAMAVIVDALEPTKRGKNVYDVTGKLRAIQRERETQWRMDQRLKKAIMADVKSETKLPLFRVR